MASLSKGLLFNEVNSRAHKLRNRVIPVQPIDMESLPNGTPLLAAILARVYRAVETHGTACNCRPSLLAEDPRDQPELQRLQQYQQRIARSLDSNLPSRRGSLDPEQYAEAVMSEEEYRLELVSDLEKVLSELSRRVKRQLDGSDHYRRDLGNGEDGDRNVVFLVPIDDIDLNPSRCIELLRLLRFFSPPRELFFLLMGQYDLVEPIIKLQMAADFGRMLKEAGDLSTVSVASLKNELAEVSLSNLRKMIPPNSRVKLPALTLSTAFQFRPLGVGDSISTLGQLLQHIDLYDSTGKAARYRTLESLLSRGRGASDFNKELEALRESSGFAWDSYCGAGTFQVPARRLVDIWMELNDLVNDPVKDTTDESADLVDKKEYGQRVHELMIEHWGRVVDADPFLSPDSRWMLKQKGPRGCVAIPSKNVIYERDLEISRARIETEIDQPGSHKSYVSYQPRLLTAALRPGTGVPSLAILGDGTNRDESSLAVTPGVPTSAPQWTRIEAVQTRCAQVLYHDLEELFAGQSESPSIWPLLSSIEPIALAWVGPEGSVKEFSWPLPPLRTYIDMAGFLAKWNAYCSSVLADHVSGNATEPNSADSGPSGVIETSILQQLVQRWILIGSNAVIGSMTGTLSTRLEKPLNETTSIGGITGRLFEIRKHAKRTGHLRNWTQIEKWLRRVLRLIHPEYCSEIVSLALMDELLTTDINGELHSLFLEHQQLLRSERGAKLNDLISLAPNLWRKLNCPESGPYFALVPEPTTRMGAGIQAKEETSKAAGAATGVDPNKSAKQVSNPEIPATQKSPSLMKKGVKTPAKKVGVKKVSKKHDPKK